MFVFALAVMAMASESAVAQVTYVYTGNAFNIFSCDESGGGCNVAAPDNPYTSYLAGDHVVATLILDSELGANFDGDASLLPGFSLTLADGQQILTDEGSAYFGAYLEMHPIAPSSPMARISLTTMREFSHRTPLAPTRRGSCLRAVRGHLLTMSLPRRI
jgi:hypothetical protein